ncbi:MAG: hypothetical protein D6813_05550 [Calditrichaeota bacterium]|nr:MAG: hypothetical protein D6813_05550 [Calditrichota bacterium]
MNDALKQIRKKVGNYDKSGKNGDCIKNIIFIGHSGAEGVIYIGESDIFKIEFHLFIKRRKIFSPD